MNSMRATQEQTSQGFGNELIDDLSIPAQTLNFLFSALLLTSVGVFIASNLLLLDLDTFLRSAQIALPCWGLLLLLYAVSSQTRSVIWGLVLTYGLLWLLVYSRLHFLVPAFYLLFMAAGYVAFRNLRVDRKNWSTMFLMAAVATATILALAMLYTSFDMLARLHAGNVHQDTLFHSSIAAMIKNYGVSSTGLHGLIETPYHVFSHVLMASISLISGLSVLEVYGVANSVLFAPILIFCIAVICCQLDPSNKTPMPLAWVVVCVLLAALPYFLGRWAVFSSFFVSESYLVSLGLLTLGLALLFKQRLTWIDLLAVLLLASMIANAKASVGLIFVGLWFTRFIFLSSDRRPLVLAAGLLAALATGWVILESAKANSGSMPVDPFHFIRTYSFLGSYLGDAGEVILAGTLPTVRTMMLALVAVVSFFLLHFGVSWLVIGRVAGQGGLYAMFSSPLVVYSLAAVLAGAAIVSVFSIGGGSAGYFSNVAFFVSLPGLVACVAYWLAQRGLDHRLVLVAGIFIICLLGAKAFYAASRLHSNRLNPQTNELISQLQHMRLDAPLNVVWQPSSKTMAANPVERCMAQPFVYPAVSERPWTGVVSDGNDGRCSYYAYGYEQYGISDTIKRVTVAPRLLGNMVIQTAP